MYSLPYICTLSIIDIDKLSMILSYNGSRKDVAMTRSTGKNVDRISARLNSVEYEQLLVLAAGRPTSDVIRELIRKAYDEDRRLKT